MAQLRGDRCNERGLGWRYPGAAILTRQIERERERESGRVGLVELEGASRWGRRTVAGRVAGVCGQQRHAILGHAA
jgi:hypothetical protein